MHPASIPNPASPGVLRRLVEYKYAGLIGLAGSPFCSIFVSKEGQVSLFTSKPVFV